MRRFKATIDLYLQLPIEGEQVPKGYTGPTYASELAEAALADGIADTLRPLCDFSPNGFIIDWSYHPDASGDFEAGCAKPFEGLTPEEHYQLDKPDDLFDVDDFTVAQLRLMRKVAVDQRLRDIETAIALRDGGALADIS
jgi:hypothetical protein